MEHILNHGVVGFSEKYWESEDGEWFVASRERVGDKTKAVVSVQFRRKPSARYFADPVDPVVQTRELEWA
jgi:hypothetical protein